jgi:hypothetical protein
MKWVMILLMLSMVAGDANSQSSVQFIFNVSVTDQCQAGNPVPDGTPVLIYCDRTNNGPSIDDGSVCDGIPDCFANFNSFELPDSGEALSVPWSILGFPGGPLYVYLLICIGDIQHYTESFEIVGGYQEFIIGGPEGISLYCVEGACGLCLPPNAPYNLNASDDDCDGILVTWQHDLDDICGFEVWCDEILAHAFDEVPQPLEYYDDEAETGEHEYRVKAIRCCPDESRLSAESIPVIGYRASPPLEIGHIWIDTTQGSLRICWTDVENEDGYRILHNGMLLAIVSSNIVSYEDFMPFPGDIHLYQVIPFNQCGDGPTASVIWVRPPEPPLVANPPALDFGDLNIHAEYNATVVLTNNSETELLWLGFDIGQGLFNITHIGGDSIPPGDSMEVDISFFADAVGEYNDTLQVEYSPEYDPLLIPLRADARRFLIQANYTSLNFLVPWGGTSSETLTLSNVGDLDVVIDTVYFDAFDNMFSVTPRFAVLPAGSQQGFQITATLSVYFANAVLHFVHNVPPDLELCIPVAAELDPGDADEQLSGVPKDYFLDNAYPNPFNPSTTISFGLPQESRVSLMVFDISGRLIQTLSDRTLPAGEHSITFDGNNLPSGVYFYRLTANQFTASNKMVLLK